MTPFVAHQLDEITTALDATRRDKGKAKARLHSRLSREDRCMLDTVNRLCSTGVQMDIDLPQVVFLGCQGSGKTSLIESITGIDIPRGPTYSPRCPTEYILSQTDSPWKCIVTLRFMVGADGMPLESVRNEQFGEVILNKYEVGDRVRRAQLAILYPEVSPKRFLLDENIDLSDEEMKGAVSFSRNAVRLFISGPDVAEFSFIDLPAMARDPSSICGTRQAVETALMLNLAISHISKSNCIIALTIIPEPDYETGQAYHLAMRFDPEGTRTIGILKTSDRISEASGSSRTPFIETSNMRALPNPTNSKSKTNTTCFSVSEMVNEAFFKASCWNSDNSDHCDLIRVLNTALLDSISERLPQIQAEIEKSTTAVRTTLSQAPPPLPEDAYSELDSVLRQFVDDFQDTLKDNRSYREAQTSFNLAIRETEPKFIPFEKREINEWRESINNLIPADDISHTDGASNSTEQQSSAKIVCVYIDDVLNKANHLKKMGNVPKHAYVRQLYIHHMLEEWGQHFIMLCIKIETIIRHKIDVVAQKYAGFGANNHLVKILKETMKSFIHQGLECAQKRISTFLLEEIYMFTNKDKHFNDYKMKCLTYYEDQRLARIQQILYKAIQECDETQSQLPGLSPNAFSGPVSGGVGVLPQGHYVTMLSQMVATRIEPPGFSTMHPSELKPWLEMMADVQIYHKYAFLLFKPEVERVLNDGLVNDLDDEGKLFAVLKDGLDQGTEQICNGRLEEKVKMENLRVELKNKLERLIIALGEFYIDLSDTMPEEHDSVDGGDSDDDDSGIYLMDDVQGDY
ncbi:hypothetical protein BDN70DRAFT_710837 [Pholiota conissans]|uniref:Dynamin GTPase domain-containing protein n=1 Tax=Pholiota conissans TaxID=109636 RepID=A0A9P6D076_9AGAR|nr:hypothetical protein BDN70DRAFT_710837 [Pholiota conissans]